MHIDISPVDIKSRQEIGIRSGDTVRVFQKIQEKEKTRIQVFEGLVLARKHGNEAGATFTVRKVSNGVGVEKIFPMYSPLIDKIEIVRRAKVRRSKLYFIREKVTREVRKQMRNMRLTNITTVSELEEKDKAKKEAKIAEEAEEAKAQEEKATAEAKASSETEAIDNSSAEESSQDESSDDSEKK